MSRATGLFLAAREDPNLDVEDALAEIELPSGDSALTFLHGTCAILAQELRRRLGWPVVWVLTDDADPDAKIEDFWNLVHAYCVPEPGLLADVRGISDDDRAALEGFEDFFDYPGVRAHAPGQDALDAMLRRACRPEVLATAVADAEAFIDARPDWFVVRKDPNTDERS